MQRQDFYKYYPSGFYIDPKKEDKSNQHRVVFFWKAKKRIEELAVTTEAALNIQWCKCGAKPQKEKRKSLIISLLRFLFSDPLGAFTVAVYIFDL